jgi:uncharacterized protein (TIGR02246 family)
MKSFCFSVFTLLVCFHDFLLQPCRAADTGPEESAIRQAAKAFVDAYDKGDANAVAAHWATDGEYAVGPKTVKGRENIAKLYREELRAHPGSKMDVKISSVRMLAPTVALEEGTASVSGSPNGPASSSAYSAVHVKQGGKWLMASVRESEVPSVEFDRGLDELGWMVGKWTAGKDKTKVTLTCDWIENKHFLRAEVAGKGGGNEVPGGMQIIGRDPMSGQIVSWFFSADGGHGFGTWQKSDSRWLIQTEGVSADGSPTAASNMLYRADKNVASWQSINRRRGDTPLPDVKEVVIERAADSSTK